MWSKCDENIGLGAPVCVVFDRVVCVSVLSVMRAWRVDSMCSRSLITPTHIRCASASNIFGQSDKHIVPNDKHVLNQFIIHIQFIVNVSMYQCWSDWMDAVDYVSTLSFHAWMLLVCLPIVRGSRTASKLEHFFLYISWKMNERINELIAFTSAHCTRTQTYLTDMNCIAMQYAIEPANVPIEKISQLIKMLISSSLSVFIQVCSLVCDVHAVCVYEIIDISGEQEECSVTTGAISTHDLCIAMKSNSGY